MTRGEWLAMELRRRLGGRREMERVLRDRYFSDYGVPFPTPPYQTLTDLLMADMIEANRRRDTSLAPYVDKYRVRGYVTATVGESALVPLRWSGRNPWAIPLSPDAPPAVLKANHISQDVLVITPETDPARVRRAALRWLAGNYYYVGGEYQYRAIRPRLLLEEFLDDGTEYGPRDYSFWCFHGEPLFVQVRDGSRELRQAYDMSWAPLAVLRPGERAVEVPPPAPLDAMTGMARTLCGSFPFVRVDFYDVHGHPYFGELTFTPAGGSLRLASPAIDRFLGTLLSGGPAGVRGAAGRGARGRLTELAAQAEAA